MESAKSEKIKTRQITPLAIIALFISLTETVATFAVTRTSGTVQLALTSFVIVFPILNAGGFFMILWGRPYSFYPPTEYGQRTTPGEFVKAMRSGISRRKRPIRREAFDHFDDVFTSCQDVSSDASGQHSNQPVSAQRARRKQVTRCSSFKE